MKGNSIGLLENKIISSYSRKKRNYFIINSKKEKVEVSNYPEFLELFGTNIYGENFYLIDSNKQLVNFVQNVCHQSYNTPCDASTIYTIMFSHEIAGKFFAFQAKVTENHIHLIFFRSRFNKNYTPNEILIYSEFFKHLPSKKLSVSIEEINEKPVLKNPDLDILIRCSKLQFTEQELKCFSDASLVSANRKKVESHHSEKLLRRAKLLNDTPLLHKLCDLGSIIFSSSTSNHHHGYAHKSNSFIQQDYLKIVGYLGFLIGGMLIYPIEYCAILCGLTLSVFSPLLFGRKGLCLMFNATTSIAFTYNWKAMSMFSGAMIAIGGEDFIQFYIDNIVMPIEEFYRGTEPLMPVMKI